MEKKGEKYAKDANKGRRKEVHLRKSKLLPKGDGTFKILKRINDNAYKAYFFANYVASPRMELAWVLDRFGLGF
ncbi:hypothetical protein CR513_38459, partial [Mucuna pruriens]